MNPPRQSVLILIVADLSPRSSRYKLAEPDKLLIAWQETPGRVPVEVEAEMLAMFRREYGKAPFANAPHLLGR